MADRRGPRIVVGMKYLPRALFAVVFALLCSFAASVASADNSPAALAQRQLTAYNARDIDAFLEPYSDDVEVYAFPGRLLYKGKDKMRERYVKLFADSPRLHCELVHRTVHGNVVIDQERVTGVRGDGVIEASALYTVAGGRIARVDFVQ